MEQEQRSVKSRAKYWRKFARRHGNLCVLCGRSFTHGGSISREHLIPQCHGGTNSESLPAHLRCNSWRGAASLVRVMRALELSVSRNAKDFDRWANKHTREGARGKVGDPPNLSREELIAAVGHKRRYNNLKKERQE